MAAYMKMIPKWMTSTKLLGHRPEKNIIRDDKNHYPELCNRAKEQEDDSSLEALKFFLN